MFKRVGTLLLAGVIGVFVLAACGEEDKEVEPTVTRVPATGAPVLEPTTAEGEATAAAGGAAAGSPAASPGASPAAASPVGESSPAAGDSPATGGGAAATAPVEINLADIKFTPNEVTIPANTDVTVNLVTTGVAVHDFVIDELGIRSKTMNQGETETITVNAPAGTYQYYCSRPGHKEAGMVGTLTVQ